MKNNQTGRSMVEMLGVLAIIGVLSAGGLAGYSKAMFKHKLNSTMEQITMLVTNIRTHFGTQKNYAALSETNLINLGVVPAVMGNTSGNLKNPFKGSVTIAKAQARNGVDNSGFTVQYSGLPKEACIALATADFGSGAGSGFVGVDVGTSSTVYIGTGNQVGTSGQEGFTAATRKEGQPYTMAAAITACSEPATVIWKFY